MQSNGARFFYESDSMVLLKILEETERERRILRDLMNRYDELKNLEQSIEEVSRLFQRIQILVLDQVNLRT